MKIVWRASFTLRDVRGLTIALIVSLTMTAAAQAPPAFDVASVKRNVDETREALAVQPDGSVRFTAFPLRTLITMAYRADGIQRFDQIVGAPDWIAAERFDISAKGGGSADTPAKLRTLLGDRFQLQLHREMRSMPAYALVAARADRKLGPQMHETAGDCTPTATAPDRWCGIRAAGTTITGHAVSTAQLAGNLSGYPAIDRFVTDRTGLTGRYDFELQYSPTFLDAPDNAAGPSLFTALTEQLGLRLQPESLTVPVLVIDRVEQPTPD